MAATNDKLHELEERLARRERSAFLRTLTVSFVPIIAAAALLWVTIRQIDEAQSELTVVQDDVRRVRGKLIEAVGERSKAQAARDQAKQEADRLRREVDALKGQLTKVQKQLLRSLNYSRFLHKLPLDDAKSLASRYGEAGVLLARIIQHKQRNVKWGLSNTQDGGFTSPGFAGFILQKSGRLPLNRPPQEALRELPRNRGAPKVGDVIVYDGGFAMFYFRDRRNEEFVAGMTLIGIVALKVQFGAKRLYSLSTGITQ